MAFGWCFYSSRINPRRFVNSSTGRKYFYCRSDQFLNFPLLDTVRRYLSFVGTIKCRWICLLINKALTCRGRWEACKTSFYDSALRLVKILERENIYSGSTRIKFLSVFAYIRATMRRGGGDLAFHFTFYCCAKAFNFICFSFRLGLFFSLLTREDWKICCHTRWIVTKINGQEGGKAWEKENFCCPSCY